MHCVQLVLEGPGGVDVGDAGVETGAQQGREPRVAEAFVVGPLPFVFKFGRVQGLVVGRIHIVHAAFQAGVHDVQVLVGQGHVADQVGLYVAQQGAEFGYIVRVHLRGAEVHVQAFFDALGNGVALGAGAAGQGDAAEGLLVFGCLGALVGHHAAHAARADDQKIGHDV